MKAKFLQDFRGRETNEQYFTKGDVVEGDAFAFLAVRGIVEVIEEPAPEPPAPVEAQPEEKKTPHKRQGKK